MFLSGFYGGKGLHLHPQPGRVLNKIRPTNPDMVHRIASSPTPASIEAFLRTLPPFIHPSLLRTHHFRLSSQRAERLQVRKLADRRGFVLLIVGIYFVSSRLHASLPLRACLP